MALSTVSHHLQIQHIREAERGKIYDEYIEVSTLQAKAVAHELAEHEGLFLGTSSAAGVYAASIVAARPENKDKNIIVITADNGFKYLSTKVYALNK